jgi:heme/copper-type cytochrome/quinol oxidase subunit 2
MIAKGRFFTALTIILACAVLAWSCASSSGSASKDETAPKEAGAGPFIALVAIVVVVLAVVLLIPSGNATPPQKVQERTLREAVSPIRNTAIKIVINVTFTYTTKGDEGDARRMTIERVVSRLNQDGQTDSNSFVFPDGEASNFTLNYTLNNVGQYGNDRFTGSVEMRGWGWGYINTFDSGEYPYSDFEKLIDALTDKAYSFIHTGWHDTQ